MSGTTHPGAACAWATTSRNEIRWNNNTSRPPVTTHASRRINRLRMGPPRLSPPIDARPLAPDVFHGGGRGGVVAAVGEAKEHGVADVRAEVGRGAVCQLVMREQDVSGASGELAWRAQSHAREPL